MYFLTSFFEQVRDFIELGGNVLLVIAFVIFAMWMIVIERMVYFRGEHKRRIKDALQTWQDRDERESWNARQIRQAMISRVSVAANAGLPIVTALVALCPLLGLLGTVTGMIEVFEVMAVSGTGNARSMASGVAKATIPTMAGMVGALSGVFAVTWLSSKAKSEVELLADHMGSE